MHESQKFISSPFPNPGTNFYSQIERWERHGSHHHHTSSASVVFVSLCVCVSLSVMDFRVNNSDPRWQKGNVYHCQLFSAVATPGPNAAHCVQGLWSCSYTKHWHVNTQKEIRRGISVKGFYAPCVSWRFYFSLFYHTDKTVSIGRHKRK